jgi:hypothetical protein
MALLQKVVSGTSEISVAAGGNRQLVYIRSDRSYTEAAEKSEMPILAIICRTT